METQDVVAWNFSHFTSTFRTRKSITRSTNNYLINETFLNVFFRTSGEFNWESYFKWVLEQRQIVGAWRSNVEELIFSRSLEEPPSIWMITDQWLILNQSHWLWQWPNGRLTVFDPQPGQPKMQPEEGALWRSPNLNTLHWVASAWTTSAEPNVPINRLQWFERPKGFFELIQSI